MAKIHELYDTLIEGLEDFLDAQATSTRDYESPDSIREDWPGIYQTVQAIESLRPSGKLPWEARQHWKKLLHLCDDSSGDPSLNYQVDNAAGELLKWAQTERENFDADGNRKSDSPVDKVHPSKSCRLSVEIAPPMALLDGKPYHIHECSAMLLDVLIEAEGKHRSGKEIAQRHDVFPEDKVSRYDKKLPAEIRSFVKTKPGAGSRLVDEAWIN